MHSRRRLAPIPGRMYRSVRKQLDRYLVALQLMDQPKPQKTMTNKRTGSTKLPATVGDLTDKATQGGVYRGALPRG